MVRLIAFSGLPGVGKTTIARGVAREAGATYLRIDSIEAALKSSSLKIDPAEDAGYVVAISIAKDNLRLGRAVVADMVNPIAITRGAWSSAARECGARILDVEVICSDLDEHRRRVESRVSDVDGLVLPTWLDVERRHFEPWLADRLVLDTARTSPDGCITEVLRALAEP